MALNCAMLRPGTPPTPVPLPDEKTFLVVAGVQAVVHPMANSTTLVGDSKAGLSAVGSVFVTSLRIVFISAAAHSGSTATSSAGKPKELYSLSVNLSHFQDGRFVQPWFGANYHESLVLPQHGGGLNILHNLKLYFNEGRAFEFYEAVEQVKARYDEARGRAGRPTEEALPLYTPPERSAAPASSSGISAVPAVLPPRAEPDAGQLEAATCARQAEAAEDASAVVAATVNQSDVGLPPTYDAASRS